MKKLLLVVALAGSLGTFVPSAQATILWYEFSFTGADLMGYSFVEGGSGTTAAQNGLYSGARLSREGGSPYDKRTYVTEEHGEFTTWATTTPHRLTSFNLWGFDGLGAGWGEDYKHMDQVSVAAPDDWTSREEEWPEIWGENPNPYSGARILGWDAPSIAQGLHFDDEDLAEKRFEFRFLFDFSDWLYDGETYGAPNTLGGPMTFWFGGWMQGDSEDDPYIYEGNMVLTGREIPEPTSLLLIGLGLAGLGIRRLRRKK